MSRKLIPMAIVYDFDGTLAPGNIQENSFIPEIGMKKASFWQQNKDRAEKHEADEVLSYMTFMLERASSKDVPVRRQDFARHGKSVPLFRGVADWFDRVNARARERHVRLQHYIISSGIRGDDRGHLKSGRNSQKYSLRRSLTTQTAPRNGRRLRLTTPRRRNIFFGSTRVRLASTITGSSTDFVPHEDRPMPFSNIVFIGDGETDIPCMRLVRDQGGHSIAVYQPSSSKKKARAEKLITDKRADFIAPADYSEGRRLDEIISAIIDKIVANNGVRMMMRE